MNGIVLLAAFSFGQPQSQVLPPQDAPKYLAKAIYREIGADKIVSNWERKHLKFVKQKEFGYIVGIGKIIIEKNVSYTWRF